MGSPGDTSRAASSSAIPASETLFVGDDRGGRQHVEADDVRSQVHRVLGGCGRGAVVTSLQRRDGVARPPVRDDIRQPRDQRDRRDARGHPARPTPRGSWDRSGATATSARGPRRPAARPTARARRWGTAGAGRRGGRRGPRPTPTIHPDPRRMTASTDRPTSPSTTIQASRAGIPPARRRRGTRVRSVGLLEPPVGALVASVDAVGERNPIALGADPGHGVVGDHGDRHPPLVEAATPPGLILIGDGGQPATDRREHQDADQATLPATVPARARRVGSERGAEVELGADGGDEGGGLEPDPRRPRAGAGLATSRSGVATAPTAPERSRQPVVERQPQHDRHEEGNGGAEVGR